MIAVIQFAIASFVLLKWVLLISYFVLSIIDLHMFNIFVGGSYRLNVESMYLTANNTSLRKPPGLQ